jgi:hypothetical protein
MRRLFKFSIPTVVGLALPFVAHYGARLAHHPDWDVPFIFGFVIGAFLAVLYLLPSAKSFRQSSEDLHRVAIQLLNEKQVH